MRRARPPSRRRAARSMGPCSGCNVFQPGRRRRRTHFGVPATPCRCVATLCRHLGTECSHVGTECRCVGTECRRVGAECIRADKECRTLDAECSRRGAECNPRDTECSEASYKRSWADTLCREVPTLCRDSGAGRSGLPTSCSRNAKRWSREAHSCGAKKFLCVWRVWVYKTSHFMAGFR